MAVWRTVRVFLSSTFRDMHAERDHLVKVVFPALRARLLPHRVELYDIDLRWGITEEESKNDKVIELCLGQIDECPLFLAFVGHRYGSIARTVPPGLPDRFPVVGRFPGVSVTELELRHNRARDPAGRCSLVLLRKEEALAAIPPPVKARDFLDDAPGAGPRVRALREELQAHRDGGPPPAQPYSAEWEPKRYDRVNRAEGRLDGLDYFGLLAEEWLWAAVTDHLKLPAVPAAVDPLDAEADLHERFVETRTRIYVGRDAVDRRLAAFALADGDAPLLLTGESGLGKSAAMARFVRDFRRDHPDVFVLAHFVGASPRTTSLTGMLKRLTAELRRKFELTLPAAESSDEILRGFPAALAAVPPTERVVIALDAVNQLDADGRAESLVWLPERLPPNVRVLCSSATGPPPVPRVLAAFGERPHEAVPLDPLSDAERRAVVTAVPKLVAKSLDDHQVDVLLANPATRNPLFLTVALEELRGFGSYQRLPGEIARLPRGDDAVTRLFERVFERLEDEFNPPLVDRTLRLLACSRRGLSGPELEALTASLGERADDLYPVLRQLRPYLHSRDGLFDFYHLSVRRAVEARYLKWSDGGDGRDPWARWDPRRPTPAADPSGPEVEARERLAEHFMTDRLAARSVDELPWHLCQLRAWPRLAELLGDLTFFREAASANPFEVRAAWSLAKHAGGVDPLGAYRDVLASPDRFDASAVWLLGTFMLEFGHGNDVLQLWAYLINRFRRGGDDARLQGSLGNLSLILRIAGDPAGALEALAEQEAICRRIGHPAGVACSFGNRAIVLRDTGDPAGGLRLHRAEEAIYRGLADEAGVAMSLGNQAVILQSLAEWDESERLLVEQGALCRRLGDPAGLARSLGNRGLARYHTGDYPEAERLFAESEAIHRRYGNLAGLAATLGNRAALVRSAQGDDAAALRLYQAQEALWRQSGDLGGLSNCLGNQSLILDAADDTEGALRLLDEQEAICRRLGDHAGLSRNLGNRAMMMSSRAADHPAALRLLDEQEAICRRLGDPAGLSACLGNRGTVFLQANDLSEALRMHREEEAICRRINAPDGLQSSLGNQAVVWKRLNEPLRGLPLAEEKVVICRRIGNARGLAQGLLIRAELLVAAGDLQAAVPPLEEAEPVYRGVGDEAGLQSCLSLRGMILCELGDAHAALPPLEEAEHLCRRLGDTVSLQPCLGTRAEVLKRLGRPDVALGLLRELEGISRREGTPHSLMLALINLATVLAFDLHRRAEALGLAEEALGVALAGGPALRQMAGRIEQVVRQIRGLAD